MTARRSEVQDLARRGENTLAEGRRRLREDGWCVVPEVLSKESTAQALDHLWAAAAESERRGLATYMPALDPNASNVRVFNLLDIDPLFRDLIRHPTALDLVRSLLGEEFLISNFTANIARPGSQSMPVHSDQALVMPGPWAHPWAMNIIWALTDVRLENGATLFLPGSHRFTDRSQVPGDPLPLMQPFEAPAGSIIAMEGRMWHTSGANVTAGEDRALLFGYYTAPFLRPQVNHNVTLSAQTQASLDPPMRHWLGLEAEANVGLAPEVFAADGGRREPVRVS
ncbi:MAG: hypothetical protein JWO83_3406 [Caulobacteraceae bacterium]|nr:hypothetical protein [Caulobacteraceae bacterium]